MNTHLAPEASGFGAGKASQSRAVTAVASCSGWSKGADSFPVSSDVAKAYANKRVELYPKLAAR